MIVSTLKHSDRIESLHPLFKKVFDYVKNPDLPINFNIKMNLVEQLSDCLKKMGKRIKVCYF